jgi:chromate transporter
MTTDPSAEPIDTLSTREAEESRAAIFWRFLKFGCLAWGGPAAQIAIKRECVDEEKWVSELAFKKQLAVYQILPGPEAHELCVTSAVCAAASCGGFLAGLGFMLPGFILMLGLSVLYVEANLSGHLEELFYGLTAAVGALVARKKLREAGIVGSERQGLWAYYYVIPDSLEEFSAWLS